MNCGKTYFIITIALLLTKNLKRIIYFLGFLSLILQICNAYINEIIELLQQINVKV